MNFKTIILVMGILLPINNLMGQVYDSIKPVVIGAKIPEINLSKILSSEKPINLYSFRGKYILIEYWATWCSSCIEHFEELDSLQNQYKSKLQIILATSQSPEIVKPFLDDWKKRSGKTMGGILFSCADRALRSFFPYKYFSTEVWITPNSIFLDKSVSFIPLYQKANFLLQHENLFQHYF